MVSRTTLFSLLAVAALVAGCADNNAGTPTPATVTPGGSPTPATATPTSDPTPGITTLKVGSDAAYPPFEDTVNGKIIGFDVDVMTEIGNRSGFTVEFSNAGFTTIIPSVQSGQFDVGASAFTINDERKQQVDFTVPYYENRLLVAVKAADTAITSEESLRGKKVCTQEGTTSEFYLRDNLGFTNDTLLLVPTAPQCKDALLRDDVAALMIDAAFVRNVIEGSEGQLKEAFEAIDADEEFGFVVKKGNTVLLTAMNAALVSMKADGTLDRIADKWQV